MIVIGCAGWGWMMAVYYREKERFLRQLQQILRYMINDLQYRRTPLPMLLRESAIHGSGIPGKVFSDLADVLDEHILADVESGMTSVLDKHSLTGDLRDLMESMGKTFGCFDLSGQIRELESVLIMSEQILGAHCTGKQEKIRTFYTLGICGGVVLAILLV